MYRIEVIFFKKLRYLLIFLPNIMFFHRAVLLIEWIGWVKVRVLCEVLNYLFLPRPKLCLGERYCFTRVSLWFCLSVCLWFRDQDSSKSSRPISMKFGRTLGYYKRKVKFEFDKNYFGRTRTSSSWILKIGISQKVMSEYLLNFTK